MKVSLNKVQSVPHTSEINATSRASKQAPCNLKLDGNKLESVDQMTEQFQKMMEFIMRLLEMLVNGVSKAAEGSMATSAAASTAVNRGASGGVSNQFLWKPSAEKDGKLVVLLPANLTGKIAGIEVKGPNGRTIEGGKFSGVHNGGREHFRFSKPGASFPQGSQVHIQMKDGSSSVIQIGNTGSRVTR